MNIRFQPRQGAQEVEARDIAYPGYARWVAGDEREIPDAQVSFREIGGVQVMIPLSEAIFRHGADFVDAASGKNPLFSCAECGEDALAESVAHPFHDDVIRFVRDGKRVCIPCYLAEDPQKIVGLRGRVPEADIARAQDIIASRSAKVAPQSVAASEVEEPHE